MLAFFRRALSSWIVVALLGLVVIAFIVTGIGSGPNGFLGGGGAGDSDAVATVGSDKISTADVGRRAQTMLAEAKQAQPNSTMAEMLAVGGGLNTIVDQVATSKLVEIWGAKHGLVASDRLVDGEIAGIPAFRSATGVFDEKVMSAILSQQRMTLADLRSGIRGDLLRRQLLVPMTAGANAPLGVARAYAGVMLSRRIGSVGFVPLDLTAVPVPSPVDQQAWYKSHVAAYSLPERRVLRYAPLDIDSITAPAPTDAEIAAQYKADATKYAAAEQRTLTQVVLPDEKAAQAFAAKVKSGTPFAKAAADAGFAPADITLGKQTKDAYTTASAPNVADAVFAAAQGATVGPVKSSLGWHIVHVDAVERTAGKTLEQARAEIADTLTKKKKADALSALGQKIEDALSNGATFDEIVKADGLKIVTTPPLIAAGTAPTDPTYKADETVTKLLKPAFQANAEDPPTVETVGPNHFALLALGPVTAAAPLPFAQVQQRVASDLAADRAVAVAKAKAQAVLDKVKAGAQLAPTLAAAGLKPPAPANASQLDTMRLQQVPPPLRTLFQLAPGATAIAAGPGGWYVIHLDRIEDGPADQIGAIANQLRAEMNRGNGEELIQQFANAAKAELPIKRNPAAIAALQRQLTGQAPAAQ